MKISFGIILTSIILNYNLLKQKTTIEIENFLSSLNVSEDTSVVSQVTNCKRELVSDIRSNLDNINIHDLAKSIASLIMNQTNDKHKLMILWLKSLIESDKRIDLSEEIFYYPKLTKQAFLKSNSFDINYVIANIILYVTKTFENQDGKSDISNLKKPSYPKDATKSIELFSYPDSFKSIEKTTQTININDYFINLSDKIKADSNNINIFRAELSCNKFCYDKLQKLIEENVISYVDSRVQSTSKKISQMDFFKALKSIVDTNGSIINELPNLLLYIFLEVVLNAPKIMSNIETVNNNIQVHSLHLLTTNDFNYQLIFGGSKLNNEIEECICNALNDFTNFSHDSSKIKSVFISRQINKLLFNESEAQKIYDIFVPQISSTSTTTNAIAILLGYSIKTSKDLNPEEYEKAVDQEIIDTITKTLPFINSKIKELNLFGTPIHFFFVPFDNVENDCKQIMEAFNIC